MLIDAKFRLEPGAQGAGVTAVLLANSQPGATHFYSANAVIYAQGDRAGPLYVVEFGVVRICRLTADGRRQINAFHFAGDVFGFEAGDEHQFYAESVNGAGVRTLHGQNNSDVASSLLAVTLANLVRAQQHQLVLGRRSATEKLAGFILDMAERQGVDDPVVGLPMQRNDIADYLGLTFETVSRALRVLKDAGIIRVPSVHQIEVLNPAALRNLAA